MPKVTLVRRADTTTPRTDGSRKREYFWYQIILNDEMTLNSFSMYNYHTDTITMSDPEAMDAAMKYAKNLAGHLGCTIESFNEIEVKEMKMVQMHLPWHRV